MRPYRDDGGQTSAGTRQHQDRAFAVAFSVAGVLVVGAVLVLQWTATREVTTRRERAAQDAARPASLAAMRGHWIWARTVEAGGRPPLDVADEDLAPRVGPSGWLGCPENIVCTRYGSRRWIVGPRDRAHYLSNVVTSSDYQYDGRLEQAAPGLARFVYGRHYSCAHPRVRYTVRETRWVRFRRELNELWLGVQAHGPTEVPFLRERPQVEPSAWLVLRRVPRGVFYGAGLLRRCQPEPGVDCDADCFSDALAM